MEDWKSNRPAFWTMAIPGTFWLAVFFLIPLGFLLVLSLSSKLVVDGQISVNDYDYLSTFTNYFDTLNADIIKIFLRTVWWSALATIACLVIGYPIAFGICFAPERWRPMLLLLIILPFWINLLIRTYALRSVMGNRGIINTLLGYVGLGPFEILGSTAAVVFGHFYVFLPFMVLPLYSTIERLDRSYLEASLDLGATQAQTFWRVTMPLTMPGIITGIILVFIPCLGMFLIADELGGTSSWMIGNIIQNQFGSANNWPLGSALAFVLMILTFLAILIQRIFEQRSSLAKDT